MLLVAASYSYVWCKVYVISCVLEIPATESLANKWGLWKKSCLLGERAGYLNWARLRMADNCIPCRFNTKTYKTERKRQKLSGDAYKWHGILRTSWAENVNHITSIFEEKRKHDLWYLWPYEKTSRPIFSWLCQSMMFSQFGTKTV